MQTIRNPVDYRLIDVTDGQGIKLAEIQDSHISVVKKRMYLNVRRPDTKHYFENFSLKEDKVFQKTEEGYRWLVPGPSRFIVVQACHDLQGHIIMEGEMH